MNFNKILQKTLEDIVKKRNQAKAVDDFQRFIAVNGWPLAVTKQSIYKALDYLDANKLPESENDLLDMLIYGQKRSLPILTNYQKKMLKKIRKIVKTAKKDICKHEIRISLFYHGGGFSCMLFAQPELICIKCGLNVTINSSKIEDLKDIGLSTTQKQLDQVNAWVKKCVDDKKIKILFAEKISDDPIKALTLSEICPYKFPFKIIDVVKFESKSGI